MSFPRWYHLIVWKPLESVKFKAFTHFFTQTGFSDQLKVYYCYINLAMIKLVVNTLKIPQ